MHINFETRYFANGGYNTGDITLTNQFTYTGVTIPRLGYTIPLSTILLFEKKRNNV